MLAEGLLSVNMDTASQSDIGGSTHGFSQRSEGALAMVIPCNHQQACSSANQFYVVTSIEEEGVDWGGVRVKGEACK